jgi:hypothetical protein
MSIAIRIDKELYEDAKRTAAAEYRTIPLQVAFWAKIGKVALENPDLPIELIRDMLLAKGQKSESFEFRES